MGKKLKNAAIAALVLLELGSVSLGIQGISNLKQSVQESKRLNNEYRELSIEGHNIADAITCTKSYREKFNGIPMSYNGILNSVNACLPDDDPLYIKAQEQIKAEKIHDQKRTEADKETNLAGFETIAGFVTALSIPLMCYDSKTIKREEDKDECLEYHSR